MKKSDTERIKKIVSTWEALKRQIDEHSITKEKLLDDEFSQWAVTTPLYNIGEQVYKISDETKKQNPQIIWSVVSGLRHRLVHDYEGINWSIIVDVIFNEMEEFVNDVKKLI
ncbi:HepT-like ribonuclease domain-containing protein [Eubacterium sp.]